MLKLLLITLVILTFNSGHAVEKQDYKEVLRNLESQLLLDLSASREQLNKLSSQVPQFDKVELFHYTILDAHLAVMESKLALGEEKLLGLKEEGIPAGLKAIRFMLLASIYHHKGDSVAAFVYTDKALALLNAIKVDKYKFRVLNNTVSRYKDADLLEFALEYGRQAYRLANKIKDDNAICASSFELASIEILASKYNIAENRLMATRKYCEKANNILFLYAVQHSLLELNIKLGRIKEARELAETLLPKVVDYGWNVLTSSTYTLFGEVALAESNLEQAKEYGQKGYALALKINDKKRLENAAGLLAKIYTETKENQEAIKYYKKYMEMNVENKTRVRQRKLAFDIARRGSI